MAPRMAERCLVLVLVVMVWVGATAQSQSQSGCTNALMGLSSCLNYVNGSTSTPTPSCCSSLSSIVQSQPLCLCTLLNATGMSSSVNLNINQTLALQLPGACSVSTPPLSQCNSTANGPAASASSPASSPTSSPAESSDNTPESQAPTKPSLPSIPAGTGSGSKTVPSTNGSSDGNNIRAPLHLIAFVVLILSCASMSSSF